MYKHYIGIAVINIIVASCLVAGFIMGGSPNELKYIGLDTTRISAFTQIKNILNTYYMKNGNLPDNLTAVTIPQSILNDPENGKPYTYIKQDMAKFDLCTTFSTDSEEIKKKYKDMTAMYTDSEDKNVHKKGYSCISYTLTRLNQNSPSIQPSRTIENKTLFFLKDATFDANPKDSINTESGGVSSGNIKMLVTPNLSNVYVIKDNNKEYLIAMPTSVSYLGDYEAFKARCWNKGQSGLQGCHYNLTDMDFVSESGVSLRKNREGAADYTVSKDMGNLPLIADFSNGNKEVYGGMLSFFAPKSSFATGKATKFYIKNFNKGWDTIAQPQDLEISILIK